MKSSPTETLAVRVFVFAFILILSGCSIAGSAWQERFALMEQARAVAPSEYSVFSDAIDAYFDEGRVRPFEEVLEEKKREDEERSRRRSEEVQSLWEAQEAAIRAEHNIKRHLEDRKWKQEAALQSLKVGDKYPPFSQIGESRIIHLSGGRVMRVFDNKDTTGVNTTVIIDESGTILSIERH